MSHDRNASSRSPQTILFALGFSLVFCLLCFTAESSGKGSPNLRQVGLASINYADDKRVMLPNSHFVQPFSDNGVSFSTSPLAVTLADLTLHGPADTSSLPDLPAPGTSVNATPIVNFSADLVMGPSSTPVNIHGQADLALRVTNLNPAPTLEGNYGLEVLNLMLSGIDPKFGNIQLRESPTLQSTGNYQISLSPDGTALQFGSFFDVFFEVSVGGGPFFAADAPFHLVFSDPVPEPASIAMAVAGMFGLGLVVRRRRSRS
jgi:uncharacterized protein (TIGR03382 family)